MSSSRTAVLLLVYFGLCFAVSIPLQLQTRLSNWDAQCSLFVGNDGSGKNGWKGQVSRLQVWNRAIPEELVQRMTTGGQGPDGKSGLLASYDFTTPAPYLDQREFLPALAWVSTKPPSKNNIQGLEIDSTSWLGTTSPVGELTRKIQGTNQFTVRIICVPEGIQDTDGQIVSISQSGRKCEFEPAAGRNDSGFLVSQSALRDAFLALVGRAGCLGIRANARYRGVLRRLGRVHLFGWEESAGMVPPEPRCESRAQFPFCANGRSWRIRRFVRNAGFPSSRSADRSGREKMVQMEDLRQIAAGC